MCHCGRKFGADTEGVEELTDYASAFRYPDAPYEPDAAEGAQALTIAIRLCDEVRKRIENYERTLTELSTGSKPTPVAFNRRIADT